MSVKGRDSDKGRDRTTDYEPRPQPIRKIDEGRRGWGQDERPQDVRNSEPPPQKPKK
jgi:hypothetical protein